MRKLYIHIGAHKSGSTSLQQALAGNSYKLRTNGVRYVHTGRQKIVGPHYRLTNAIRSYLDEKSKLLFQKLSEEIRDADEHSFIISSEGLENLGNPKELQPFVALKNELDLEIIVLFLVRAHAEQFNSTYVEVVRQLAIDATFDEYLESRTSEYKRRYERCINIWSPISDRMIVAEFSVENVENILRNEFGVSISLGHANQSINPLAIEVLRRLRSHLLQKGKEGTLHRPNFQHIIDAICTCAAEFDSTYAKFWGFTGERYESFVEQCSADAAFLKESFGVTFSNAANKQRSIVVPPYNGSDKELLEYVETACHISSNSPKAAARIDTLKLKRQFKEEMAKAENARERNDLDAELAHYEAACRISPNSPKVVARIKALKDHKKSRELLS